MTPIRYRCSVCCEEHEGLPDIGFSAPIYWRDDHDPGSRLTSDLCVVDGEDYFIRCVLEVPIVGHKDRLGWGVWLTQSEANFRHYEATFHDTPDHESVGYLANRLPGYPETLGLIMKAHWRADQRPLLAPQPVDHPLCRDCAEGITLEQAIAFVTPLLHPS